MNLKSLNPRLKVLVAVGGWTEGSTKYSVMSSAASSRKTFIKSAIDFIQWVSHTRLKCVLAHKVRNNDCTFLCHSLTWGSWYKFRIDTFSWSPEWHFFVHHTTLLILYYRKHRFDGLDLDWEYPANRGGVPADKENFVSLVKVGDNFMEMDLLFIFHVYHVKQTEVFPKYLQVLINMNILV